MNFIWETYITAGMAESMDSGQASQDDVEINASLNHRQDVEGVGGFALQENLNETTIQEATTTAASQLAQKVVT